MSIHNKNKILVVLLTFVFIVAIFPAMAFASGVEVDLSVATLDPEDLTDVKGAIWQQFPGDNSSGTGNFNTYLSMQALGNNTTERGYNSDRKTCEFDEKKTWTMALPLSAVPLVEVDGSWYREFVVDVNQTTGNHLISLDYFQVWQTDLVALAGYDESTHSFPTGAVKIYDIDGSFPNSPGTHDVFLTLDYLVNSGSGWHDYRVLVPNT